MPGFDDSDPWGGDRTTGELLEDAFMGVSIACADGSLANTALVLVAARRFANYRNMSLGACFSDERLDSLIRNTAYTLRNSPDHPTRTELTLTAGTLKQIVGDYCNATQHAASDTGKAIDLNRLQTKMLLALSYMPSLEAELQPTYIDSLLRLTGFAQLAEQFTGSNIPLETILKACMPYSAQSIGDDPQIKRLLIMLRHSPQTDTVLGLTDQFALHELIGRLSESVGDVGEVDESRIALEGVKHAHTYKTKGAISALYKRFLQSFWPKIIVYSIEHAELSEVERAVVLREFKYAPDLTELTNEEFYQTFRLTPSTYIDTMVSALPKLRRARRQMPREGMPNYPLGKRGSRYPPAENMTPAHLPRSVNETLAWLNEELTRDATLLDGIHVLKDHQTIVHAALLQWHTGSLDYDILTALSPDVHDEVSVNYILTRTLAKLRNPHLLQFETGASVKTGSALEKILHFDPALAEQRLSGHPKLLERYRALKAYDPHNLPVLKQKRPLYQLLRVLEIVE